MAKSRSVPNKHLHARATFLYQAATYLTLQSRALNPELEGNHLSSDDRADHEGARVVRHSGQAMQLGSHLRAVSTKGQVRLSAEMKRSLCKACNTVLVPGKTSTHIMENKSRGGRKPWADILVIQCNFCGSQKRLPTGSNKQQGKSGRSTNKSAKAFTMCLGTAETVQCGASQAGTEDVPMYGHEEAH
ncbi:RNAse P Rpr2/Rpp21/SNM1 subunit domain-domain-containing protein [Clohesyomyces aquaticus]|uniref:RNAse P Rpr2/Rpp21/SNM1 subunit domain-domain-containing protein n=1 Tax=Clohesyomyces aquaticus TaxID=1231657 RepID=A0A1Y1ZPZ5_9PLEO|nr:RNAse P Rpr2/Rpp21/SNM1 subunit domain-domain-containing protein [Clohesyomyces aquaticus]